MGSSRGDEDAHAAGTTLTARHAPHHYTGSGAGFRARTCSVPLSPQKKTNHPRLVPKPNAMLMRAVDMRPPARSTVGENLAPSTPLMNLEV